MIVKQGGKYYVYSKSGKKLSKGYNTRKEAEARLKEIEQLKHINREDFWGDIVQK